MKLSVINQSGKPVPRRFLNSWVKRMELLLRKCLPREKVPRMISRIRNQELVIVFLSKKAARELNKQYRGKDYATDVLSFESLESGSLGELVICPEVISKQAREHGLLVREELGYMVLHGVLHLLGFDHEKSKKEAKIMFDLQDQIFEKLLARRV